MSFCLAKETTSMRKLPTDGEKKFCQMFTNVLEDMKNSKKVKHKTVICSKKMGK